MEKQEKYISNLLWVQIKLKTDTRKTVLCDVTWREHQSEAATSTARLCLNLSHLSGYLRDIHVVASVVALEWGKNGK